MFKKFILLSFLFLPGCKLLHFKCCEVQALAWVKSTTGTNISGWVRLERAGFRRVQVTAHIQGLRPNSVLGFHVHEFGSCEQAGLKAGGHFNPCSKKHGNPDTSKQHHKGDLGNLQVDSQGVAKYSRVIRGKTRYFLGRSIIIHNKADDFVSQPSGQAGKRLACGVLGVSPKKEQAKK